MNARICAYMWNIYVCMIIERANTARGNRVINNDTSTMYIGRNNTSCDSLTLYSIVTRYMTFKKCSRPSKIRIIDAIKRLNYKIRINYKYSKVFDITQLSLNNDSSIICDVFVKLFLLICICSVYYHTGILLYANIVKNSLRFERLMLKVNSHIQSMISTQFLQQSESISLWISLTLLSNVIFLLELVNHSRTYADLLPFCGGNFIPAICPNILVTLHTSHSLQTFA